MTRNFVASVVPVAPGDSTMESKKEMSDLQAEAKAREAGANPVIVRNQGSLGARDLHLENFSVSNGGKDLIQASQKSVCDELFQLKICQGSLDDAERPFYVEFCSTKGESPPN